MRAVTGVTRRARVQVGGNGTRTFSTAEVKVPTLVLQMQEEKGGATRNMLFRVRGTRAPWAEHMV